MQKSLALCTTPTANQTNALLQSLMANVLVSTQMNFDRLGRPFNQLMFQVEKADSPIDAIVDAISIQTKNNGVDCLNWRPPY